MDESPYELENFIERLIMALAEQVQTSATPGLTPEARAVLAGLSRFEARKFFGITGHLAHYGNLPAVESLAKLVGNSQRTEDPGGDGVQVGDRVRLVGPSPVGVATDSDAWLRATVFSVCFVDEDGTVDIQPDLLEDYVIMTVSAAAISVVR